MEVRRHYGCSRNVSVASARMLTRCARLEEYWYSQQENVLVFFEIAVIFADVKYLGLFGNPTHPELMNFVLP